MSGQTSGFMMLVSKMFNVPTVLIQESKMLFLKTGEDVFRILHIDSVVSICKGLEYNNFIIVGLSTLKAWTNKQTILYFQEFVNFSVNENSVRIVWKKQGDLASIIVLSSCNSEQSIYISYQRTLSTRTNVLNYVVSYWTLAMSHSVATANKND